MSLKVKVKKLNDWAKMPHHGSEDAAGWDLYSDNLEHKVNPGETVLIPTGISMEIPYGHVGLIFPRSGLAVKQNLNLANCVGVIDADYRGEIKIPIHNVSRDNVTFVGVSERIGQMIIMPYPDVEYVETQEIDVTVRGEGGFGSTGIN